MAAGELASLDRGLQILAFVQDEGRASVAEICSKLALPSSTVYRYVRALEQAGFLVDQDGSMVPSGRLAESGSVGGGQHLVSLASGLLTALRDSSGLTVALTVRVHSVALCLDTRRSLTMRTDRLAYCPGEIRPLYAGASVTPLLAYAPAKLVKQVLADGVRKLTAAAPDEQALMAQLHEIRETGHHTTTGWINPGLTGVGVPVLVDGRCICALSVVGPTQAVSISTEAKRLERAAAQLSGLIGRVRATAWMPPSTADFPR